MPEVAIPETEQPRKSMIKSLNPLTADDVMAFLEAKSASKNCPCCGTWHWKVNVPHEQGFAEVSMSATDASMLGTFYYKEPPLSMIVLECEHCGFVRTHSARAVAEWKGTWVTPPNPQAMPA